LVLDEQEVISWWHRMVARQGYYLQGWQKRKVYPDFLAFSDSNHDKYLILETKGDHLKGNDDTKYKKRLFTLLEKYSNSPKNFGTMETASKNEEKLVFEILMERNWETQIEKSL